MRIYYTWHFLTVYEVNKGSRGHEYKRYHGDFIHDFGDYEYHFFKGSSRRHLVIEKYLYRFNSWLIGYDAVGWYKIFRILLTILYGLNCNFPKLDILRFLIFQYKTKRLY